MPNNRNPDNTRKTASNNSDAADRRFERDITALYRLGPRAIAEAFRHLGATSFRMTESGHRFVGGRHD